MVTFVLNDFDARDAYVLRAIAARDERAWIFDDGSLLSRAAPGEGQVRAATRARRDRCSTGIHDEYERVREEAIHRISRLFYDQ